MRVVRVLFGFALANLAAACTLVLFVYAPADWAGLRADVNVGRLSEAGALALAVTPHIALYAAVPVLAGAVLAEVRKITRCTFYALAGIAAAAAGFVVLHLNEPPGQATMLHNYILAAFLTSGLIGGLTYWAFAGRLAAGRAAPAPEPPRGGA